MPHRSQRQATSKIILEGTYARQDTKNIPTQPHCDWVIERTLAWTDRCRRFSKDYERKVQTSEYLIQIAMTRLMLKRLARSGE